MPVTYQFGVRGFHGEKNGTIRFNGTHSYTPGDYTMKVDGTIDPKKRRVSIRESDPSSVDSETNGSFEGMISDDLQAIEAAWIISGTEHKGDLKVRAKKGQVGVRPETDPALLRRPLPVPDAGL